MEIIGPNFVPGDPRLIDHIVCELKAQGIFDQFRKECIADVDTKPAYQNLRQRVESNVTNFLNKQKWSAELNKNQVREMLRKDISESGFLETGVERIVDQVVNPKINTVFLPQVENVVYKYLGIKKPSTKEETIKENKDIKPLLINIPQNDLLPHDLEAISPESETAEKKNDQSFDSEKTEDNKVDEDESPPFEPLEGTLPQANQDENSVDSHISGLMGQDSNHSESKFKPDNSNQDSQFSKQSSGDGHLSMDISEDSSQSRTKWMEVDSKSDPNSNSFSFNLNDNENKFQINSITEQPVKEDIVIENNKEEENKFNEITENKPEQVNSDENKEIENGKSKSEDKKSDKYKSSDKHKSRHEKSKEKDKKDKEKKDKSASKESKERKSEKDKSKSDKDKIKSSKSEKDKSRSDKDKEKDNKHKIKSDKDQNEGDKSDKDKNKSDKQRDKSKSEKDKSRDDKSKSKDSRDKSKDGKDKIKDKESEKKETKHKTDKSDETKEKSSSSKYKSKDDQKEKSSKSRTKSENGSDHKPKSDSKQKKKSDSKSSDDFTKTKEISKHKKDEKRDKSKDSKRDSKRSSKDDHYGSKGKKWDRRSTDRDSSDGRSGNYSSQSSFSETPQKQTSVQESSNSGSGSGDSGNSDDAEGIQDQCQNMDEIAVFTDSQCVGDNVPEMQVKLIKPKFASNIYEAMRLMKIRKQLHKIEKQKQMNCFNNFNKTTLLTSDNDENNKTKTKTEGDSEKDKVEKTDAPVHEVQTDELVPPPLANQVITQESWDALEAKLATQQNLLESNDDKEHPNRDEEEIDTNKESSMVTESENTDDNNSSMKETEKEQERIEIKPEEVEKMEIDEKMSCSNEDLSTTTESKIDKEEEKPKPEAAETETEDSTNISHLNLNCPSDTDNLTHLKSSLEKLEQDISLITSIVNKRQQKPTETLDEGAVVKRNVLSDSNIVVVDNKAKKQQVFVSDTEVPSKPAPKRGRKRKGSGVGSCDVHNNNKIENHVARTDTASIAQVNHKVPNNTIPINSKIPAKKKKPNGDGVVTTDVKLDLCSLDGQKPVKNGKKETPEPPKTTKRKNTTERLSANLQRYSSDDLYKPRLNFHSRRRSARALEND